MAARHRFSEVLVKLPTLSDAILEVSRIDSRPLRHYINKTYRIRPRLDKTLRKLERMGEGEPS